MRNKAKLTEELVKLLPYDCAIDPHTALHTWWFNIRKNGGMRLTATGYTVLAKTLDLEHYTYLISDPMTFNQHMILDLDRKLQMPYYIHAVKGVPKALIFFGNKEAVMVNLFGDLKKFLDNYNL